MFQWLATTHSISTVSGSALHGLSQSTSPILGTELQPTMCAAEHWRIHIYSHPDVRLSRGHSPNVDDLPAITVTRVLYATTTTCPAVIGTKTTHSMNILILTSISTLPCEKCGPNVVTLTLYSRIRSSTPALPYSQKQVRCQCSAVKPRLSNNPGKGGGSCKLATMICTHLSLNSLIS